MLERLQDLPREQKRSHTTKLNMVLSQLSQLQNYTENVNILRQIQEETLVVEETQFDSVEMVGQIAKMFLTQTKLQRT